jgi:hypothetical protein
MGDRNQRSTGELEMKRSIANAIKSSDKAGQYALVSCLKQDVEVSDMEGSAGGRLRDLPVGLWRGYPRLTRMLSSFGQSGGEDEKAALTLPHIARIEQRDPPVSHDTLCPSDTLCLSDTRSPARLESEVL